MKIIRTYTPVIMHTLSSDHGTIKALIEPASDGKDAAQVRVYFEDNEPQIATTLSALMRALRLVISEHPGLHFEYKSLSTDRGDFHHIDACIWSDLAAWDHDEGHVERLVRVSLPLEGGDKIVFFVDKDEAHWYQEDAA